MVLIQMYMCLFWWSRVMLGMMLVWLRSWDTYMYIWMRCTVHQLLLFLPVSTLVAVKDLRMTFWWSFVIKKKYIVGFIMYWLIIDLHVVNLLYFDVLSDILFMVYIYCHAFSFYRLFIYLLLKLCTWLYFLMKWF